jgi:hypothetical protein
MQQEITNNGTSNAPKLGLNSVSGWAYIYENWSAIALGMMIATVFWVIVNIIENIAVKIALIIAGS